MNTLIIKTHSEYGILKNKRFILNNLPDTVNGNDLMIYYTASIVNGQVIINLAIRDWSTWATLFLPCIYFAASGIDSFENYIKERFNETLSKDDIIADLKRHNLNGLNERHLPNIAEAIETLIHI